MSVSGGGAQGWEEQAEGMTAQKQESQEGTVRRDRGRGEAGRLTGVGTCELC